MHANARIGSMMYVWCMPSSIILQYVRCKWSDDQFSGRLVLDRDMILRFAGSMMGFMHVWHSKPFKATLSILTPQNYGYFGSPPNTTAGHTGSNKPWPIGPGPIWSLWKMLFWGCQNWDPKKKKNALQEFTVRPTPAGRQNGFVPFWTQDSEQRDWQPKEIYEDFAAQHLWRMSQNRMW